MIRMLRKVIDSLRRSGRLAPLAVISALLPILGTVTLVAFSQPIGMWLRANWELGLLTFFGGITFLCGLALLPPNMIGIVSGWAFGFELGLFVLIAGLTSASFISFVVNSRLTRGRFENLTAGNAKLEAVHKALIGQDFRRITLVIILLRMSIIMPFALTNFLMASARVSLRSFIAGTALGMLPRSAAMVLVGAGLSELSLEGGRETWLVLLGIAATIASVLVIANVSRRALDRLVAASEAA